jgi:hypothetical protein
MPNRKMETYEGLWGFWEAPWGFIEKQVSLYRGKR